MTATRRRRPARPAARPGRDRRLPGLRRARQRHPAGLLHADLQRHRRPPRRSRDADVNWFEAAQLIVSALVVPLLARLGDLVGHKKVLLLSTAVTALGSWILAFAPAFTTFLIGWAIQGAYVVWLPLEVAIIHRRTAGTGRQAPAHPPGARRSWSAPSSSAVIIGALTSGALVESTSMTVLLMLPAIVVTLCFVVIWFGIEDAPGDVDRAASTSAAWRWSRSSLGLVMGGLIAIRLAGPRQPARPGLLIVARPGSRWCRSCATSSRTPSRSIDVRLLATPAQWPVQLTAFLFGMSVLGAQIPLSTFARTDPDVAGYGLGADAAFVSTLIGVYVVFLAVGAFTLPLTSRLLGAARRAGARPACWSRSATRCGCRSTTRPPGAGQHGDRRPRLRAPWSPRCPPPPRPPRRPTAPASPPA